MTLIRKYWIEILIVIAISLCGYAIYIYYMTFHNLGISKDSSNWSHFGDYITGAIGSILSFFSILLIYLTYKNQVRNSLLQQFETTFFNLLQNQREILKSMKGYISDNPVVVEMDEKIAEEYINKIAALLNNCFDGATGRFINEAGLELWQLANKEATLERIKRSYNKIYKGKEAELGHYFRHMYHIFKYVDESRIPNRKKYIDIIQAQMSDNELYITLYNGICQYGNKHFLPMLDEYYFFENVRTRGEIFDYDKKMFYPKTNFKYNTIIA